MNLERDKFLNKLMGGCWHTDQEEYPLYCYKCECVVYNDTNFSTPEGFFALWKWAQKQTWWKIFIEPIGKIVCDCGECNDCMIDTHWVDPDLFADIIYEFLMKNNK